MNSNGSNSKGGGEEDARFNLTDDFSLCTLALFSCDSSHLANNLLLKCSKPEQVMLKDCYALCEEMLWRSNEFLSVKMNPGQAKLNVKNLNLLRRTLKELEHLFQVKRVFSDQDEKEWEPFKKFVRDSDQRLNKCLDNFKSQEKNFVRLLKKDLAEETEGSVSYWHLLLGASALKLATQECFEALGMVFRIKTILYLLSQQKKYFKKTSPELLEDPEALAKIESAVTAWNESGIFRRSTSPNKAKPSSPSKSKPSASFETQSHGSIKASPEPPVSSKDNSGVLPPPRTTSLDSASPGTSSRKASREVTDELEDFSTSILINRRDEAIMEQSNSDGDEDEVLSDEDVPQRGHNRKVSKFFGAEESELQINLLKSVRKEPYLSYDYEKDDCTFDLEGQVSGATVDALIERLTLHDEAPEHNFVKAFWLCFRCFISPRALTQKFIARFHLNPPEGLNEKQLDKWKNMKSKPIKLRLANALKHWLEFYWITELDIDTIEEIQDFVEKDIMLIFPSLGKEMQGLVEKRLDLDADDPTGPRLGSKLRTAAAKDKLLGYVNEQVSLTFRIPQAVIDLDPTELAYQLTIMDSRLFNAIKPRELVGQEFSKKSGSLSFNVRAMTAFSTQLTTWIVETVLNESDMKKRALLLKHFLKVGERFYFLRNYDCLFAINSALTNSSVLRLKKTWKLVPSKSMTKFVQFQNLCSYERNYAAYRSILKGSLPPCLPFIGMYLTDLTFIDDGNSDLKKTTTAERPVINFGKYLKTVTLLNEIAKFQAQGYKLEENRNLELVVKRWIEGSAVELLTKGPVEAQQSQYERSLQLEPRI